MARFHARQGANPDRALEFTASGRFDVRYWLLLLVGLAFAYAGYTVDPRTNCDTNGECAPWLVPIALVIGVVSSMAAAAHLIVNAQRGSYIDLNTRELVWWEGKVRDGRTSDEGRLALDQIARVKIVDGGDSSDDVYLYDHNDQLLPFAGSEVIRWPFCDWAEKLADHCPGLTIDQK